MSDDFYRAFEDAHRGSRESVKSRLMNYLPALKALQAEHPNPKAMDIGCGRGEWLELLRDIGFEATGVDLDQGMLAVSLEHGLDVRHEDGLTALKGQHSDSFSMISMFHLVEHVEFDVMLNMLVEAGRVLKPGGVLLVETPNPENIVVGTSSFYLDPTHSKPLPQQLLKFAVEWAGFAHADILRLNHPPALSEEPKLRLVNVLFHVSPDYAVLAVKEQMKNTAAAEELAAAITKLQGLTLEWLSERMSAQQARQVDLCTYDVGQLVKQVNELRNEVLGQQWHIQNLNGQLAELHAQIEKHAQSQAEPTGPESSWFSVFKSWFAVDRTPKRSTHVFVDVSNISVNDLNTGIERVVKAYLAELRNRSTIQVIPVKLLHHEGGWRYETCLTYLGTPAEEGLPDFQAGDVLWGLDYFPYAVHMAEQAGVFAGLNSLGVRVVFQVYDILPITHPEFFPQGAGDIHALWMKSICRCADDLICISNSVVNSIEQWAAQESIQLKPALHAVHLGANLPTVVTGTGQAPDSEMDFSTPFVLSVGTIEPRKGHDQTLAAFDLLWSRGSGLRWIVVGQEGWKSVPVEHRTYISGLCERLEKHDELGKKLLWFKQADDSLLDHLYKNALGVLVPSRQEGYGLPLIEAAHHKAPLLVRDIPVFREVAGTHACFFNGDTPEALANCIDLWEKDLQQGQTKPSGELPWMNWSESLSAVFKSLGLT